MYFIGSISMVMIIAMEDVNVNICDFGKKY